jgi:transposase InsO family protein
LLRVCLTFPYWGKRGLLCLNKKAVQEQIVVKQKYAAQGQMDISYLWTDEGWLYLSIVLDLFNREVVGWSLKPRMTTDIVTEALTMA